ncbi:hypothetical protein ACP4OV_002274 [Aristida adscensionis]
MADLALGGAGNIFRVVKEIKEAVENVRQNEEECQRIQVLVANLLAILSLLQQAGAMNNPAMDGALEGLDMTLDRALKLVKDCQKGSFLRRFLASGSMSRKLLRMENQILHDVMLGVFATNVQLTITLTRTSPYGGAHHPALTELQDSGQMETTDAPSRFECMAETLCIVFSITGIAESSSPALEATMQQFSELDIDGQGCQVLKQKIVFRVSMMSEKARIKALQYAARADGVSSLGITGDGRDWLEVVGEGVDPVGLLYGLRRRLGAAEILQVEEVKEQEVEEEEEEKQQQQQTDCYYPG